MKFTADDEEELSVNLAPLIDVVFLLLIFFMVTTTFNHNAAIDITLPEADATASNSEQSRIFINVDALGEISIQVEGSATHRALKNTSVPAIALEIKQTIKNLPSTATEPVIVIHADKSAQHGKVIELMEAVGEAGLYQIEFAVKSIKR